MQDIKMAENRIIVALDYAAEAPVLKLVDSLDPTLCRLKIGKELFTALGPEIVEKMVARGFDVFLDLKFHDIPNTVAKAVKSAANLGVWMLNVHASGGQRMMEAARDALDGLSTRPLLIAVTVLTSMGDDELQQIGIQAPAEKQVIHLAKLAKRSGMDGVVCSGLEVEAIKKEIALPFYAVTPGIRLLDSVRDDQQRVLTPTKAIGLGSDYLVIGRPITQADDPLQTLKLIASEISSIS